MADRDNERKRPLRDGPNYSRTRRSRACRRLCLGPLPRFRGSHSSALSALSVRPESARVRQHGSRFRGCVVARAFIRSGGRQTALLAACRIAPGMLARLPADAGRSTNHRREARPTDRSRSNASAADRATPALARRVEVGDRSIIIPQRPRRRRGFPGQNALRPPPSSRSFDACGIRDRTGMRRSSR